MQQTIREHIAQNRLDEALAIFTDWAVAHPEQRSFAQLLTQVQGGYAAYRQQQIIGTATPAQAAKLRQSLLLLLEQLPESAALPATRRLLFFSANPRNTETLRIDEEYRGISAVLHDSPRFDLRSEWAVRIEDLQTILLAYRPQILHFSGHGTGAGLIVSNQEQEPYLLSNEALAELVALLYRAGAPIELVVLNACHSAALAALLAPQVRYVIGMDNAVPDAVAIAFSEAFYRSLDEGIDLPLAFDFAMNQLKLENLHGKDVPVLLG